MIYGNNVRLEKENDNREVRCRLLMKKTTAAAECEVSSGLNYWQFANAAVAVMRKKDRVFDLFYFPCRNLTGPLVCGPRDVFEFKLFGADFVYHLVLAQSPAGKTEAGKRPGNVFGRCLSWQKNPCRRRFRRASGKRRLECFRP